MPALWIITPFSENNCDSAITNMVSCYADYSHVRVSGGGAVPLNEGSYNLKCHFGFPPGTLCGAGDAVIIVAHGAESGSALYSASCGGTSKTQAGLFNDLRGFRAKRARRFSFRFVSVPSEGIVPQNGKQKIPVRMCTDALASCAIQ